MRKTYDSAGADGSILNSSQIGVGETVSKDDLLYLCGLSGKAFEVDVSNYAAVGGLTYGTAQTNAATGQIVAQTSIIAGIVLADAKQAVLQNVDKFIFTLSSYSGSNGATLTKFSAGGTFISSVNVDITLSPTRCHKIFELSNGNIAVVYVLDSGAPGYLKFAIYDTYLVEIKSLTTVATVPNTNFFPFFGAVAMAAGGFAVVYQDSVTPLESKLATYSNTGAVVQAAITVWTRTGTSSYQLHAMVQLSNGNLAIAVSSVNTVSSIGLYYLICTTAGVSVLAPTSLDTTSVQVIPSIVSSGNGYFAIARANGTNQKAWVFDNAGVIQGSGFSAATTVGAATNNIVIIFDGNDFYLIWHRSSDTKCVLTKIPITGTGYLTTVITTTTTQYNFYISAFYEDGYIVGMSESGGSNVAPTLWVVSISKMRLVDAAGTTFGAIPGGTSCGNKPKIISGGDRAFIAMYDYIDIASTNLCIGKWAATIVLGVSAGSAAKDTVVSFANAHGAAYKINPIGGSPNKSFDMTSNPMIGGKGTIVSGGAVTFV